MKINIVLSGLPISFYITLLCYLRNRTIGLSPLYLKLKQAIFWGIISLIEK